MVAFIRGVECRLGRRHQDPPALSSCTGGCSPEAGLWAQTCSSMGLVTLLSLVPLLLTWCPSQKTLHLPILLCLCL